MALNFTVTSDEFGETKNTELVPGGNEIAVTNENRIRYIYMVANYKLNLQIAKQSNAFLRGLSDLISPHWLRLFNARELDVLVSGAERPIDIDDLRRHTNYQGTTYEDQHPTIVMFWNVLHSFDNDQKRQFLRFVTSCSRPPLLGFKELQPKFAIGFAGEDAERLPTASTCVNYLKLPNYKTETQMREKLLYAMSAGAGFELS